MHSHAFSKNFNYMFACRSCGTLLWGDDSGVSQLPQTYSESFTMSLLILITTYLIYMWNNEYKFKYFLLFVLWVFLDLQSAIGLPLWIIHLRTHSFSDSITNIYIWCRLKIKKCSIVFIHSIFVTENLIIYKCR